MKRINLRSARRTPEQEEADKPKVVQQGDQRLIVQEHLRAILAAQQAHTPPLLEDRAFLPRDGDARVSVRRALRDNINRFDAGESLHPTEFQALASLREWFRRPRAGYEGAARVQEFGNGALCRGRVISEVQTARYRVGGSIKAEALLLDTCGSRAGLPTTLPHLLGMRLEGEDFIFESPQSAVVLARHIASIPLVDMGAIPNFHDHAFLQVTREWDTEGDSHVENMRFFARIRGGREFADVLMIETETDDWMGNHHIEVQAYNMEEVQYVPTRWENFRDFFRPEGGKVRDLKRTEEVRFVQRPRNGGWLDYARGRSVSLRPCSYPV